MMGEPLLLLYDPARPKPTKREQNRDRKSLVDYLMREMADAVRLLDEHFYFRGLEIEGVSLHREHDDEGHQIRLTLTFHAKEKSPD